MTCQVCIHGSGKLRANAFQEIELEMFSMGTLFISIKLDVKIEKS